MKLKQKKNVASAIHILKIMNFYFQIQLTSKLLWQCENHLITTNSTMGMIQGMVNLWDWITSHHYE